MTPDDIEEGGSEDDLADPGEDSLFRNDENIDLKGDIKLNHTF